MESEGINPSDSDVWLFVCEMFAGPLGVTVEEMHADIRKFTPLVLAEMERELVDLAKTIGGPDAEV